MSETIDIDKLLKRLDDKWNVVSVPACRDAATCIRQLRAERDRELENAQHLWRRLSELRQRADSAEAALSESDETWRHNMAEARKTWEAEIARQKARAERAEDWYSLASQQKAELLSRAEKAEAAVVAVADAAQHQRIRADNAEARCDRLRAARDDMERRLAESIKWNQTAAQYAARIADLEKRLAERPTMGAMREALGRFLYDTDRHGAVGMSIRECYAGTTIDAFERHFAPLAADGNASISSKSSEGPPTCERCGNRLARLCPQCDAAETFDGLLAEGPLEADAPDREDRAADALIVAAIRKMDPEKITPQPQCDHCGKPSTHSIRGDGCDWWFCDECHQRYEAPAIPESADAPPISPAEWEERP